jgi:acetyl-CoA C-acetyltransferase
MKEVYIVSAVRTPIGAFGGMLAGFSATQLGSFAIKGAIAQAGIDSKEVQEVIMGNVVSAGLGQAPARQAALGAGLHPNTICTTVNKVCASGMKSIMYAAQTIMCGGADVIVAGGMESMSNIPFYVPKARFGYKYGNAVLEDGLQRDGLEDVYQKKAMGVFADATAKKYDISRIAQDEYAINSYKKIGTNTENGNFKNEIVAIEIEGKKGKVIIDADEEYKNVFFDKIPNLKPAFTSDGTVTAANASTINDGAAAMILVSKEKMLALGLKPIAKIVAFADGEQEPEWFTTAPTIAAPKALKVAKMEIKDINYFEVNEAFAVVPMTFNKVLGINPELTNFYGGAVALGHPLGCSGTRIVVTLNNILHAQKGAIGMAAICNGGGGASAIIIEAM